jgi:carboxylesterase
MSNAPFGCLILHGFTSSLDTVRALEPMAQRLGVPYRMPLLRGHGTQPEDLIGVRWQDWYADAQGALDDLLHECDRAVVCGLSMGGLVALHLAAERSEQIAGVVTIAAALNIRDPLARFTPLVARWAPMISSNPAAGFSDPALSIHSTNYRRFPLDAVASLYRYSRLVRRMLPRVHAPLLVLHSRRDRTILPRSAQIIYSRVGSHDRQLRWFETCGHQMLQDCETEAVVAAIEDWIRQRQPLPVAQAAQPAHPATGA